MEEKSKTDLFFEELNEKLKNYPSTLEEWKEICEDFKNEKVCSFGYRIRQRMDSLIDLNEAVSKIGHFKGWYDEFDACEDLYASFFKELLDIHTEVSDKYGICTDPTWLWENDERSTGCRISFLNEDIIPDKKIRIIVKFHTSPYCIGNVYDIDLTIDDKSILNGKSIKKLKKPEKTVKSKNKRLIYQLI